MGVKVNRKDRRVVEQDRFGGELVVFRAVEKNFDLRKATGVRLTGIGEEFSRAVCVVRTRQRSAAVADILAITNLGNTAGRSCLRQSVIPSGATPSGFASSRAGGDREATEKK
jgi:hypothetical protein